jgi:GNAT superfamily N-acetyltransferase
VIDFGCSAVGDPACDLTVAWTMFDAASRELFRSHLAVEPSAWARARGWALWKALIHLTSDLEKPGRSARRDRRVGWHNSAASIVDALVRDVRSTSVTARAPNAEPGRRIRGDEDDGSPRFVLREPARPATVVPFAHEHLPGILRLCESEGWPSLPADPDRAGRVLTAPGVTTVVAIEDGAVAGFAQMLSDGELQAFLACLVVGASHRRSGLGRVLVEEALRQAGGERIDLLSEAEALGFYAAFPHQRKPGFRVYPFFR